MATSAVGALIKPDRIRCSVAIAAASLSIALSFAEVAEAQALFKYRGADGHWVYSDRRPPGAEQIEQLINGAGGESPGVWLRETIGESGAAVLTASNRYASWVQIAFHVDSSRNLEPGAPAAGNSLIPPHDEVQLMALAPIDAAAPVEVNFSYQYLYGHPGARHRPNMPYRLPYALDARHRVSQAYPDIISHATLANRHAIDFEMPIGTAVLAARKGVVIEVAEDFLTAGLDLERDGGRANFVRILHDDGTHALYGHLNWKSVRVTPGQQVARGEHIADSGNTGFSSGPHLHFVVQRNRAGAIESVPVNFVGAAGEVLSPRTGDRLVAY